jgi:hypothetical protein
MSTYSLNAPIARISHDAESPGSVRSARAGLIGGLFISGFVVYGVGFALVTSVVGGSDFLASVPAHQHTLVLGAFLMLLNTVVDVGKGVLFFPILARHSLFTALAYLATVIVEVVLLAVGVVFLLLIVPLAHQAVDSGQTEASWARSMAAVAVRGDAIAYQIAEMSLAVGCIILCSLLLRSGLVPSGLARWGVIGYAALGSGAVAETFGLHIALVLSIPGRLFEVALGVWLIVKGFRPEADISRDSI